MGRFAHGDILDRSRMLALNVVAMVRRMPQDTAAKHLSNQLLRSATSVGANLREADTADSIPDFCNKLNIAQKEASEAAYWLELLVASGIAPAAATAQGLLTEMMEMQRICRQIIFSTRTRTRRNAK
jgi:four helix bundle protein